MIASVPAQHLLRGLAAASKAGKWVSVVRGAETDREREENMGTSKLMFFDETSDIPNFLRRLFVEISTGQSKKKRRRLTRRSKTEVNTDRN